MTNGTSGSFVRLEMSCQAHCIMGFCISYNVLCILHILANIGHVGILVETLHAEHSILTICCSSVKSRMIFCTEPHILLSLIQMLASS